MCANTLNTNLKIKHEKQTGEHFSINERRNKQNDAVKKICNLNKRIKRSQNKNTVNPQISLFCKSNKKVIKKDCCISTVYRFVISCRFCKGNFDTVEKCQNHVCAATKSQTLLNESEIYRCHLCLMLFKEGSALDEHLRNHNHNNCNDCDAQFSMYKELCAHSVTAPEKLYLCAICKKSFDKKESLNLHTKSHVTAKTTLQNKCLLCNKIFADSQQYNQHMMVHRTHVCELCNITYTTYKLLKKHQQDLHDVKVSKKHQCEICDKCFNRPLHLTVHKRVHTGEKPLKCLDCNKNYYSNKTFTKHLKTIRHLNKVLLSNEIMVGKKYACEKCEGKFFNLQDLQRHVKILHSNEEPLKCDHCTYSTKCKANLKRHSEIHSQTKRFACELCNQTFRSHGNLKDHHAFIHSDKREFLCNICKKSFKVNRDLQRHKKIHSDDKPYKCSCTCSFKRLSHLKRHKLSCKHADFDKLAHTDELNKNMLDDVLESCDDPIQFSNNNNSDNLILEPEVISSSDMPNSNSDSILASNGLCLPYNEKTSEAAVLHSRSKTIEHSVVTLTDTVSTKNISISLLPNVFENPITTYTDQISIGNVNLPCSAVNWIGRIPSQTTTMPLITTLVTPPVMALKTSKLPETTSSTIVTASIELPLVSFAENISLSSVPSVVEQPVTNNISSNLTSNSTSIHEMTTSIDKPALNVIGNSVSVLKVQEEPLASNKETHQRVSQTLPQISSESILTNLDNNSLNNFTAPNVLNTANYNQPQLQNIPTIIVPKSAAKEYPNSLQTYSAITQDLEDQLLKDNKYILCSVPKSKNLVSNDLSNIEHKRYSGELLEQTNVLVSLSSSIPKTLSIPYSSLQPVNVDSVDENLNQLPHLFNLDNIMGSLNNSVENLVSDYPVTLNNLIFSNEALLNSLLNNAGFESPS